MIRAILVSVVVVLMIIGCTLIIADGDVSIPDNSKTGLFLDGIKDSNEL